ADLIAAARSSTERDLRLYRLLGALRTASAPSNDPVAGALGIFARSAQEALGAGVASHGVLALVQRLREAGQLLRAVVESDDRMLISRRLLDVAHRLDGLRAQAESTDQPVPIESLTYDADADVVPIERLAPDGATQASGLEISYRTLERLVKEGAPTSRSLAALLGGGATAAAEEPAVAITTLCYTGQAALQRANVVRQQIAAQLQGDATLASLKPLVQELLDLVPLALVES
ncbi:MAG TPA: hypothetical protein VFZ87_06710, partial [Gemmatimonadales bacterium]